MFIRSIFFLLILLPSLVRFAFEVFLQTVLANEVPPVITIENITTDTSCTNYYSTHPPPLSLRSRSAIQRRERPGISTEIMYETLQ